MSNRKQRAASELSPSGSRRKKSRQDSISLEESSPGSISSMSPQDILENFSTLSEEHRKELYIVYKKTMDITLDEFLGSLPAVQKFLIANGMEKIQDKEHIAQLEQGTEDMTIVAFFKNCEDLNFKGSQVGSATARQSRGLKLLVWEMLLQLSAPNFNPHCDLKINTYSFDGSSSLASISNAKELLNLLHETYRCYLSTHFYHKKSLIRELEGQIKRIISQFKSIDNLVRLRKTLVPSYHPQEDQEEQHDEQKDDDDDDDDDVGDVGDEGGGDEESEQKEEEEKEEEEEEEEEENQEEQVAAASPIPSYSSLKLGQSNSYANEFLLQQALCSQLNLLFNTDYSDLRAFVVDRSEPISRNQNNNDSDNDNDNDGNIKSNSDSDSESSSYHYNSNDSNENPIRTDIFVFSVSRLTNELNRIEEVYRNRENFNNGVCSTLAQIDSDSTNTPLMFKLDNIKKIVNYQSSDNSSSTTTTATPTTSTTSTTTTTSSNSSHNNISTIDNNKNDVLTDFLDKRSFLAVPLEEKEAMVKSLLNLIQQGKTNEVIFCNDSLWNLSVGFVEVKKEINKFKDVYQTASYIAKRFLWTNGSFFVPSDRTSMFGLLISKDQAEVVKCDFTFNPFQKYIQSPVISSTAFCSNPAHYDLNIHFWIQNMTEDSRRLDLRVNENVFKYHRDSNYFKGYPLCWKQVFGCVKFKDHSSGIMLQFPVLVLLSKNVFISQHPVSKEHVVLKFAFKDNVGKHENINSLSDGLYDDSYDKVAISQLKRDAAFLLVLNAFFNSNSFNNNNEISKPRIPNLLHFSDSGTLHYMTHTAPSRSVYVSVLGPVGKPLSMVQDLAFHSTNLEHSYYYSTYFNHLDAVYILKESLEQLTFLHSLKIVHGDISPSNIVFVAEESVKQQPKTAASTIFSAYTPPNSSPDTSLNSSTHTSPTASKDPSPSTSADSSPNSSKNTSPTKISSHLNEQQLIQQLEQPQHDQEQQKQQQQQQQQQQQLYQEQQQLLQQQSPRNKLMFIDFGFAEVSKNSVVYAYASQKENRETSSLCHEFIDSATFNELWDLFLSDNTDFGMTEKYVSPFLQLQKKGPKLFCDDLESLVFSVFQDRSFMRDKLNIKNTFSAESKNLWLGKIALEDSGWSYYQNYPCLFSDFVKDVRKSDSFLTSIKTENLFTTFCCALMGKTERKSAEFNYDKWIILFNRYLSFHNWDPYSLAQVDENESYLKRTSYLKLLEK